jgi:hypothetical protein
MLDETGRVVISTANQPTKESEWEEFEAFSSYTVHAGETPTRRNSPAWQEEQTMYATKSQLTQREREVLCPALGRSYRSQNCRVADY